MRTEPDRCPCGGSIGSVPSVDRDGPRRIYRCVECGRQPGDVDEG